MPWFGLSYAGRKHALAGGSAPATRRALRAGLREPSANTAKSVMKVDDICLISIFNGVACWLGLRQRSRKNLPSSNQNREDKFMSGLTRKRGVAATALILLLGTGSMPVACTSNRQIARLASPTMGSRL